MFGRGSGARIVYAGTRQVYGVPEYLPVDEGHPFQPVDFNGVHKLAATMYHLMLSRIGHLDAVVVRLTNVYGPRMAMDVVCQGFLSTYIRQMMLGEALEVFGDGCSCAILFTWTMRSKHFLSQDRPSGSIAQLQCGRLRHSLTEADCGNSVLCRRSA